MPALVMASISSALEALQKTRSGSRASRDSTFSSVPVIKLVSASRILGKISPRVPVWAALMLMGWMPTIFSALPKKTLSTEGSG